MARVAVSLLLSPPIFMKKICFPATNRVHLARQQLLLDELRKKFEVVVFEPTTIPSVKSVFSIMCAIEFNNFLSKNLDVDAILIRGDRYEMLGLTMVALYKGLTIIHIEGGDLSGAVDNKVRYAITHLSDYHFCTNDESHQRLIQNGVPINKVWNFGSLDVEFAKTVEEKKIIEEPYLLVAYHPIEGENENEVERAMSQFTQFKIINIASNNDYGKQFGSDNYSSEDYINLLRFANCCVGNSSSFLKEASILGTPVVNIGSRQNKRLKPHNVVDVPCKTGRIRAAIDFHAENRFEPDLIYYKLDTSKNIVKKLIELL